MTITEKTDRAAAANGDEQSLPDVSRVVGVGRNLSEITALISYWTAVMRVGVKNHDGSIVFPKSDRFHESPEGLY